MFVSPSATATKSISLVRLLLTSRKVKRKQHRRGPVGNIRLRLSAIASSGFAAGRAAKYKIGETYLTAPCRPQISPPIISPTTILRSPPPKMDDYNGYCPEPQDLQQQQQTGAQVPLPASQVRPFVCDWETCKKVSATRNSRQPDFRVSTANPTSRDITEYTPMNDHITVATQDAARASFSAAP